MPRAATFRDAMAAYARDLGLGSIGSLTEMQRSKLMVRFFVFEIEGVLDPDFLPDDEEDFELCHVDDPNDAGIDYIAKSKDTVLIIQAKHRGRGITENPDHVESFFHVFDRIHPNSPNRRKVYNERLTNKLADIDWDKDQFRLLFISTGKKQARIEAMSASYSFHTEYDLNLTEADRIEHEVICEDELNLRYREAQGSEGDEGLPLNITFSDRGWVKHSMISKTSRPCYLGFITAGRLWELARRRKSSLFQHNIRNYLGDRGTNKAIRLAAQDKPEEFVFLNNGISAVATEIVEETQSVLACKGFSIINGAQTERSLEAALRGPKGEMAKRATVVLKLTEVEKGKSGRGFLEDITKSSNTQTRIKVSDFRSNDLIQLRLGERVAKLKAVGGKRWRYLNKRQKPDAAFHTISMERLAKVAHAFLYGPADMYGSNDALFDATEDGRYWHVFGDAGKPLDSMSDEGYGQLLGIWFYSQVVDKAWTEYKRQNVNASKALSRGIFLPIRISHIIWRTALISHGLAESQVDATVARYLYKMSDPTLSFGASLATEGVRDLVNEALAGLQQDYSAQSEIQGFADRNYFRSRQTLDRLERSLSLPKPSLRQLALFSVKE